MLFAHPMSLSSVSQPGRNRQAHHLLTTTIARPKEVLASEKAPRFVAEGKYGMGMGCKVSSAHSHHVKSSAVLCGCVHGINGFVSNMPSMVCKVVRYALPSGITRDAWANFPCRLSTSLREWCGVFSQL